MADSAAAVHTPPEPRRGAVILAGGAARRLGGVDKPGLDVGGRTLLDVVVDACRSCAEIVIVGPHRPTRRPVRWALEEPPGSGPLAAIAAGTNALPATVDTVAVLAADLPHMTSEVVERLHLARAAAGAEVAMLVDEDGRHQHLAAVYSAAGLRGALAQLGALQDRPVHHLVEQLSVITFPHPFASRDVDLPADLARLIRNTVDSEPPGRTQAAPAKPHTPAEDRHDDRTGSAGHPQRS